MRITAQLTCPIVESFRVEQIRGMFDLPRAESAAVEFDAEFPPLDEPWDIGLIVGPSGSGKSTIARQAFGEAVYVAKNWPADRAVIDCFGEGSIQTITSALSSVGFSSPPAWIKPYSVLSNGEQFRCHLARALLESSSLSVFDEFTSVVDRTVAKIASAAVAKAIRSGRIHRRFVAVSCHYDIADWLQPDWTLDMSTQILARGRLRRPPIELRITRTDRSAWRIFKRHHYLSADLHAGAKCFLGSVDGVPAAFTAVLYFPHAQRSGWREHRTVCLPDFQGVGIGNAMSELVASLFIATGRPYFSTTGHPAMMRYRARSTKWKMRRAPSRTSAHCGKTTGLARSKASNRLTAGFEYVGLARPIEAARFGLRVG